MRDFNFNNFENIYNFNYLNDIDCDVHTKMLNNFFKIYTNKDNLIVFDVGCNGGSFIKIIKNYCHSSDIHCFEPHPRLYEMISNIYSDVNINNFCVSDKDDFCDIFIPSISVGLSSLINRPVFETLNNQEIIKYKVKCQTIDSYCIEKNISKIDYLKIDVEGAEMMVLNGCKNMLENNKILGGQFEIGQTLIDAGTSESEIIEFLMKYGYNITYNISKNDVLFTLKK